MEAQNGEEFLYRRNFKLATEVQDLEIVRSKLAMTSTNVFKDDVLLLFEVTFLLAFLVLVIFLPIGFMDWTWLFYLETQHLAILSSLAATLRLIG